jgi:hypothetical protein
MTPTFTPDIIGAIWVLGALIVVSVGVMVVIFRMDKRDKKGG